MEVYVLRLGHRVSRDKRISTHCGLVSRAFGAKGITYSGEKDDSLIESINKVSGRWGGDFKADYQGEWRKIVRNFRGKVVHLTVYGMPVQKKMAEIRRSRNLLVVVGGEKVPADMYNLADWNISVTSQPHSEIAALAVFLDRLFEGKKLSKKFAGDLKVIPAERGKNVMKRPGT